MKNFLLPFYLIGAIMVLVGAASHITGWFLSPYIYTIGACLFALAQVNHSSTASGSVVRRLRAQQIFGAFALIAAGGCMFFLRRNEWIAVLTIGAVLQLYTIFRLDAEEKKQQRNGE